MTPLRLASDMAMKASLFQHLNEAVSRVVQGGGREVPSADVEGPRTLGTPRGRGHHPTPGEGDKVMSTSGRPLVRAVQTRLPSIARVSSSSTIRIMRKRRCHSTEKSIAAVLL